MIRTNLATRPFYNVRLVNLLLAIAACVALAATVLHVAAVLHYSGSHAELATRASADEAAAANMRADAQRLRATVDPRQTERAAADAREANALIDRRMLSWTALFNTFEATLPPDVRITSIQPKIDRAHSILLTVIVQARSVKAIDTFMEQLDALGAFTDVQSTEEQMNGEGQVESSLQMRYEPGATSPEAAR
ncbi:MAG: PilN domain-containing protein [Acidobacteriaceae bacterium]|nr:PilN domain-containing protein [Acidobacteriaceae bacterium]